jgi:importin subunit beta-1
LAATRALALCLDFVKKNFAIKQQRDIIMSMIFSTTQCPDVQVRVVAYECLVGIVCSAYYVYLPEYIENIFKLVAHAIQNEPEEVTNQPSHSQKRYSQIPSVANHKFTRPVGVFASN